MGSSNSNNGATSTFDGLPTHQLQGFRSQRKIENCWDTTPPHLGADYQKKEEAMTKMKMQLYESGVKEPRNVREREKRIQTLFQ